MGDHMVWSYSSDSSVKSYASTFSSNTRGIILVNNSSNFKTVDLDLGSDTMRYNYYWYDVYANNETDKKIFVNGQTSNFIEGGPENYASIPSYYRPVNGNNKFELKPYSVKFIANSDYLLNNNIIESDIDLILYPNPFDEIINFNHEYKYDYLKIFDINAEVDIVSAHRTPSKLVEYAENAHKRGLKVIIAGAGGAAHLPGMIAAFSPLPVIGVPIKSINSIDGWDSILSILQMPGGVPVATVALNGAKNAGILAAQILGSSDKAVQKTILEYKETMKAKVIDSAKNLN